MTIQMLQDFGQANPENNNIYYFSANKYDFATTNMKENFVHFVTLV